MPTAFYQKKLRIQRIIDIIKESENKEMLLKKLIAKLFVEELMDEVKAKVYIKNLVIADMLVISGEMGEETVRCKGE